MTAGDPLQRLLAGEIDLVTVAAGGTMTEDAPPPGAVLPGSFNPLHRGHQRLAEVVAEMTGLAVVYELSVLNVDKPPLEEAEVRRRLHQFEGRAVVVLTRARRFFEKVRLLPGRIFIVGCDTAVRLVDARYYDGDERAMRAALAEMRDAGCRFLVAGREHEGAFRTLADVPVPDEFADLFEAIPEERFRVDVSSTALRGE